MELVTIARPYAKAVFDIATEANALDQWSEMLQVLAALTQDDKVRQVLGNPSLSVGQQAEALVELCGDQLNDMGRNFVQALAYNKRLELLPEVAGLFEQLKAARQKAVEVELISALPLTQVQQDSLVGALSKRVGQEIKLQCSEDQSLMGGVIIRAGDVVIDGSIRGKLEKLAYAMKS